MCSLPQIMIPGTFSLVIEDITETCENLELDVDKWKMRRALLQIEKCGESNFSEDS